MTKFTLRAALLAAPALIAAAQSAQAGGFYLQEQSARGAGRAFSGEAADTGPASLWWNPASIGGQLGFQGSISASAILPKGNVDNVGTVIVRPGQAPAAVGGNQRAKNPINNGFLPSGAISYGVNDVLALGLTVTSPYSFTTNYSSSDWVRYTADKTSLRTADIAPSVAFQFVPGFTVGAAMNWEYAYATLSNSLPNLSAALPDGHQGLKGDGWDVGYSVGAQLHQGPLSLGVSYKSSIKHTLHGSITTAGLISVPIAPGVIVPLAAQNGQVNARASFSTPWQLTGSIRYAITPKLTLNGQVVRYGWKKFDAITITAPTSTVVMPENYRNTWSYAIGADYAVNEKLTLRAGVQRDQTPTRDGNRDARVPDANRWNFSGGGSYALSKGFTIDAAASYLTVADATIDRTTAAFAGTAVQTPILVNGRLDKASVVVLSVGGRLAF